MTAPINRREAIGLALLGGALAAACGGDASRDVPRDVPREPPAGAPGVLGAGDLQLLTDVADTLLPTTDASPGARAAGVGPAMQRLLTDCYAPDAQRRAAHGLAALRRACRDRTGRDFSALQPPERERFLRAVDAEARRAGEAHDFHLLRELAERAYFTSEVGMTRARRYVRVPGRWQGCVPLAPGQPAWG